MMDHPFAVNSIDKQGRIIFWSAFGLLLAIGPHLMPNNYWLRVFSLSGIYSMLALGLNWVAGFAGLLDLAYVAFFGIGAYIFAFFSSTHFDIHLPFLVVLPVSALLTAGFGFALGATSIRLKGDYLAIVTLAFSQIFKLLLLNLDRPVNVTGGVNGIYNFDPIRLFGLKALSPIAYSYLIWGFALLVLLASFRVKKSRFGRGWMAIRDDELAAEAMGVQTTKLKLFAFASGAFIAGGAGAIFASFQDSVFPNNFDFPQLVIVYCMVILGGLGNIPGVLIGAILLSILPEFLREYGAYRMIAYGLILIVLMALRPQGIMGSIGFLTKDRKRPDKDETGVLKASTELYYDKLAAEQKKRGKFYTKGERTILELRHVTQDFGGIRAIDDLNMILKEREILSIIGPNGAGTTTIFNLISGIYRQTSGEINLEGRSITGFKPHQIVRAGLARTFQNLRLFGSMSVIENVKVAQFCRTRSGFTQTLFHFPSFKHEEAETENRATEILGLFGKRLTGYRLDQPALFLSYANRRRLEIARAMGTEAKVLLLDEPSAGMNPQETFEITEFISQLRDFYGYTIIVIEHKLNVVRTISDRVIALDYGKKIAEGTYDEVADKSEVIEAYLGRKGH